MTEQPPPANSRPQPPDKVTLAWLFQHVPVPTWGILIGFVVSAFAAGIAIGRTTLVSELIGKELPTTKVLPPTGVTNDLSTRIQELSTAHMARLAELNSAYLREEQAAGDHTNPDSWRAPHTASANRIREAINDENKSFNANIDLLNRASNTSSK